MCLILIAQGAHPDLPLVVAANRDESYLRPSAQAQFWPEANHVLAGRDLEAGGTWLGLTRQGRFAAVTNIRSGVTQTAPRSRGALVQDFLLGDEPALEYCQRIMEQADEYRGFNLLVGNLHQLVYCDNLSNSIRALPPGTYGLSNHQLDTPWPKVVKGKNGLSRLLENWHQASATNCELLLDMLTDREIVEDEFLPDTGVGLDAERLLSPIFIEGEQYGTRCSTALIVDASGQANFHERSFNGSERHDARYQFQISKS